MSHLAKLTVTQLKRAQGMTPQEGRRAKLVTKLEEQLALAAAQSEGKSLVLTKHVWKRDEGGNKTRVQQDRVVRPWWWADGTGLSMVVRYGAKPLELSKGKRAISIAQLAQLPGALQTLIAAVKAGELDAAIDAAIDARKLKLG